MQIVESILTGESTAVEKNTKQITTKRLPLGDRINMGYMSTMVVKGRGKGVVVATAEHTEMGKISLRLSKAKTPRTPLQKKLTRLGLWLVVVSVVLCVLIVVIGFARGNYWLDMLRVGISLAVSVIPEGLVAVTTVTMAIGVSRMAKHSVVVRKLHAVETLGSITTICSDKTGTLTEGKMRATKIWVGGHEYRIKGRSMDHTDTSSKITRTFKNGEKMEITRVNVPEYLQLLLMGAAVCNNTGWMEDDNGAVTMTGDPTEIALHLAAMKVGLSKEKFTQEQGFTFVNEFAFDSERKRMSVVYKSADKYYCFVKGAPESLLLKCTHYHSKGQEKPLEDKMDKIEKQATKMAAHGLRILAFGYKSFNLNEKHDEDFTDIEHVENQLNFIGLIGLMDSPRKEVAKVIQRCQGAGIRVCMITGDHPSTAKAIAIKLGLAGEQSTVLTGDQIDMLASNGELKTLDPFPTVFARVSPDNKLQIVEALQSRNEVVSMTGDGVNDAPAIKRADCGVAMGITGTDITKQSASIVLADDNFKTIAYAVQEGRRIYDNIKKFILYLLSCNAAEIFVMLLAVIIGAPVPFAPIQILWANIIADIPPAMSLGIDPSEKDVMARKPRNPKQGIFTVRSALVLVAQGLSMAGLALGVLLVTTMYYDYDVRHARSVTFTVLTMTQLWHSFLSRSQTQSIFVTGLIGNRWLIGAFFLSTTLLVLSIYVPGFNDLIELYPLNGYDWIAVVASMIVHTAVMELIKACLRLRARLLGKKKKPSIFYEDV
jgi:Ca2+-transporting ATPase